MLKLTEEQKKDKLNILVQLTASTNASLWSALITVNGFILTLFTLTLSINIDRLNIFILISCVPFLIFLFSSCFYIYKLFKKQRSSYLLYEKIIVPENFLNDENDPDTNLYNLVAESKKFPFFEKMAIRLIIINIIYIFVLFVFIS